MTSDALVEVSPACSQSGSDNPSPDDLPGGDKSASDLPVLLDAELSQQWLSWQCQMIAGNLQGLLFSLSEDMPHLRSVARWPETGDDESKLTDLCIQAVDRAAPRVLPFQPQGHDSGRACDLIAVPLLIKQRIIAVVGLVLTPRSEAQRSAVIQLLQWGGVWLESLLNGQALGHSERHTLLARLVNQPDLQAMSDEFVQRIALQFDCERVSLGLNQRGAIKPQAATDRVDDTLLMVMAEASDQQRLLQAPSAGGSEAITLLHQQRRAQTGLTVCSYPLLQVDTCVAVLTLERQTPFSADETGELDQLCQGVPALLTLLQQRESGWLPALFSPTGAVAGLFHKRHWLAGLVVLAGLLLFMPTEYRVPASANVEASERQLLVAPHNGYIRQVDARVGDQVVEGQTLLFLEDSELQLQRQKWQGEKNKLEREYQDALARGERTQLSILRARIDQVDADIQLVAEGIRRSQVVAPFAGVLLSGDKHQSLGAAVNVGEPLFEIAPLGQYRVILQINEYHMTDIEAGRQGTLIFTALPDRSFRFEIDRLMPAAQLSDQGSHFLAEASLNAEDLTGSDTLLRPGMQGLAKIHAGEHSYMWVLTHRLLDRLRLWFWSLGG